MLNQAPLSLENSIAQRGPTLHIHLYISALMRLLAIKSGCPFIM